ncbi:TPA: hypothetical protein ACUI23_002169 [Staphylococcus pseudintermedius]
MFFPEAVKHGATPSISEYFYIKHILKDDIRKLGYTTKTYVEKEKKDFLNAINKNESTKDHFVILLDVDFNPEENVDSVVKRIRESIRPYLKKANQSNTTLDVVLTSRAFETFLCFYNNTTYTKPYQNDKAVYKDMGFHNYEKKEKWFEENRENLQIDLKDLIIRIKKSRQLVFNNHPLSNPIKDIEQPDYFNDDELKFLCMSTSAPFTYFDVLLQRLLEEKG